jgi:protein involved in polysaccharide export with SLBB domain
MKKLYLSLTLFMCLAAAVPAAAQSSMTDQQVIEYAKAAVEAGKDQTQIAKELAARGVTRAQVERIRASYSQHSPGGATGSNTETSGSRLRRPTNDSVSLDRISLPDQGITLSRSEQVFGRNIFNTRNLTFEPSENLATPPNYRLGPGDEVIIDIWGASQNTIRETISPDGTINITDLGPVSLNGMTVAKAESYLKEALSKIYADQSNQIRVTLGNSRTIQINIMGEVLQPGTYALSAFSTVFHALYRAGGVSDIGSLRNVQLVRNGRKVATVDVYDFIMQGRLHDDISLQEGDVIIVPAYDALVQVDGAVKRPMRYEMKNGETLSTLFKYAGGFTGNAYTKQVSVVRQNGQEYEVKTFERPDYSVSKLQDGDVITVDSIMDRFANRLEIRGAVYRPGIYELNGKISTVRELVNQADGLMDDAFTGRAVLYRERPNKTREVKQIDIRSLMAGETPDVPLQKNDVLYIPSIHDLEDLGNVQIFGEVTNPGTYPYADNMTLEDLVIGAGGLNEAASVVRVDVSRRIRDNKGTEPGRETGEMFTFALKDGFVVDGQPGFTLQPYDQVFVRRSPAYQVQQNVQVNGEVVYGGTYALTQKNERISELLAKAGGPTPYAYVRGAKLTRVANEEEKARMADIVNMMRKELGEGAIDSLGLKVQDTYTIGINLEEALQNPGTDADIVLREGDVITVPEYVNTVKISGAVMMDNTVTYQEGKSVKYYLSQAGGYSQNAKKSKKFIIYMNGQIAEVKGNGSKQIEPGCEIVVPNKKRRPNVLNNILGYATTFASLGTMAASIANMVK